MEIDTWNDAAVEAAWSETTPAEQKAYVVYATSKLEAERKAWKWVEDNKPEFVLNTILPNMNVSALTVQSLLDTELSST